MAQLIKLQDYVSRYEMDLYRYPSQFVRLKKQQWEKFQVLWEHGEFPVLNEDANPDGADHKSDVKDKAGVLEKVKGIFRRRDKGNIMAEAAAGVEGEENLFSLHTQVKKAPKHIQELKQSFLDQLFRVQITWASSTLVEKSYIDNRYLQDERLKFLLQRFPDTFLILYEPILQLKKAPVELDVILITPTALWCLTFLEEEKEAVYIGSNERFWMKRTGEYEKKVLNPLLALNRMDSIIKQLFRAYHVDFPIRKAILCRNGFIDYPMAPQGVQLIDERQFPDWFGTLRQLRSPLKMMQLRAAKSLLEHGQTKSIRRSEWEKRDDALFAEQDYVE
ncbi:MAG TPA: nuclease-related domain-containing protein [Chondromyces sp.]|nr:nuclease-related domain-containing protein [Chondromyces sp.]